MKSLTQIKSIVSLILVIASGSLSAQVIFNQRFEYTTAQNGALLAEGNPAEIGWRGSYGPNGTALPFSNEFDGFVGSFAWSISDGNFLYATNNDDTSNPQAWMIHTTGLDVQYSSAVTTGYGTENFYANVAGQMLTGKTYGDLISLDIEMRNPDATDLPGHFALEVDLGSGPEWVVSDTPFFGTVNSFTLYSLTTDGAAGWLQNVYTPDSFLVDGPLSGTPVTIPDSAPITGYGIYFEVPNSFTSGGTSTNSSSIRVRLRQFNITTVAPTPIVIPVPSIVVTSGTDAEVSFQSETGLSYQLQKTIVALENVTELDWIDVGGASVAGDGTEKTLIDLATLPGDPDAFYRVVVTN